jgi:TolB protein
MNIHKMDARSSCRLWALLVSVFGLAGCTISAQGPNYRLYKVAEDAAGGGDSAISPDGHRFVTSLKRSGNWDLWVYDLDKQKWSQATNNPADDFEGQWSPDGGRIVFTSTRKGNKDVFLLSLADGSTRQLTDDPEDDEYANFSPDGSTIVYTGGRWLARNFWLVGTDGRNRRTVPGEPGKAGACSFHPWGSYLTCHSYDSGTGNVYLHPLNGGTPLRLTSGPVWDYKPTVSPDAKWVAFSRSMEAPSVIWLMPFPTGVGFALTNSNADDRWPTWSKDGNRLLFHRLIDRGAVIRIYDRTTAKSEQISAAGEMPGQASFSPDGKQIVYSAVASGSEELRIRDLSSGKQWTVATAGMQAAFPRWSPDGKQLAFCVRAANRWDIATANIDGSGLTVWTEKMKGVRSLRGPVDWSPDGRRVVFHASSEPFEAGLYLVDTRTGAITDSTRDHWFSEAPSFTPDGRELVFMSTRGGNWTWGFFAMPVAGGPSRLMAGPDYIEKNFPRVGVRGELLWSAYGPDGVEYLHERTPDGAERTLKAAGPWARWPSYSHDGARIVYTTIEHRVEYWLADNLRAPDSPLNRPPAAVSKVTSSAPDERASAANRSASRSSPVQLHHR